MKIAVTSSGEQVAAARRAVEELGDMLAEIYAEHGQPTADDRAWAREALGLDP